MNNHFCSIGLKLSKISANSTRHRHHWSDKKIFDQCVFSSIFLDPTDEYEINKIIDNLNAMKPPGLVSFPTWNTNKTRRLHRVKIIERTH